jgi:hypothetical protein
MALKMGRYVEGYRPPEPCPPASGMLVRLSRKATVYKLDLAWQRASSRSRAQTMDAAIIDGVQIMSP